VNTVPMASGSLPPLGRRQDRNADQSSQEEIQ